MRNERLNIPFVVKMVCLYFFFDKFVIALFLVWQHNTSIDTAA